MADQEQKIRVGMVLFPNLTQLDLTGPHEVLSFPPPIEVDLLWHRLEPVISISGFVLTPTATFDDYEAPDVLFIPGGPGQLQAMDDEPLIDFVKRAGESAKYITSVCTGSLVLAAAGLLVGKRATSHWSVVDQLALMGAEPVRERVVEDGNIITGAGVTAGIDFALTLVSRLINEDAAKNIQLGIEYDPDPPFNDGSIETADPARVELQRKRGADLAEKRREAAMRIGRERLGIKL